MPRLSPGRVLSVLSLLVLPFLARAGAPSEAQLARGKYLVNNVGMCSDCHTPHQADGSLDMKRFLQGAKLEFGPPKPLPFFATYAPPIAGQIEVSEAQIAKLLETGKLAGSVTMRIPMPAFRLTSEDAAAVAAYLRSLPTRQPETADAR